MDQCQGNIWQYIQGESRCTPYTPMYIHPTYKHPMYIHPMYIHPMQIHPMYKHLWYTHSWYTHPWYTHPMYEQVPVLLLSSFSVRNVLPFWDPWLGRLG